MSDSPVVKRMGSVALEEALSHEDLARTYASGLHFAEHGVLAP